MAVAYLKSGLHKDQIKDLLYAKAAAKIEDIRKSVADSMFDETEVEQEEEPNGE